MDTAQLSPHALNQFSGSGTFYRWPMSFGRLILSEGAAHVAANGSAWLVDVIASHYTRAMLDKAEGFLVAKLRRTHGTAARFEITDGNDTPPMVVQEIPYTDFPLENWPDGFALWIGDNGPSAPATVYLPSEH
jgi:hypothetical protein